MKQSNDKITILSFDCCCVKLSTNESKERIQNEEFIRIFMTDTILTPETILETAEQVLRRFGPDKATVLDVARALGVSHGTLYRHFSSKSTLREAVTERWLERITEPLTAIANQSQGDAAQQLYLWLNQLISIKCTKALEDPELFATYTAVTAEATGMIDAHVDNLIAQIQQILERGITQQELVSEQPSVTARAIFNATSRFHHPAHAKSWTSSGIDQEFQAVWSLILTGIQKN
jgi:AcrR family transcriptional regulator